MQVERRESEYGVGVGVTMVVCSAWLKPFVKKVGSERREKIVGLVTGGGGTEYGVGVGVVIEVGSAWVVVCGKP